MCQLPVDEEAIPQGILKLDGAMDQLSSYGKSDCHL